VDNEYKLSLHFILDKIMYVKPCFVAPDGLNVKWSKVKPYAQCVVPTIVNWIENCILMNICEGLLAICIFFIFRFIGVQLFWRFWILSYICVYWSLVFKPIRGFSKSIHIKFFVENFYIILKRSICPSNVE